jgi:hypothetical protein
MVDKLESSCELILHEEDARGLVEGLSLNAFFLLLPLVVLVGVLLALETQRAFSASLLPPKSESNACWSEIPFNITKMSICDTCGIFIQKLQQKINTYIKCN